VEQNILIRDVPAACSGGEECGRCGYGGWDGGRRVIQSGCDGDEPGSAGGRKIDM
jgi:hypothetical protein